MSWAEEAVKAISGDLEASGASGSSSVAELVGRLEGALSRAASLEEIRDILGAGSVLLQTTSFRAGETVYLDWARILRSAVDLEAPAGDSAVIALGDVGHSLLSVLAADAAPRAKLRRLFLDVETSRQRNVDPEVVSLVLESYPSTEGDHLPRYGDLLRSAYRAAAGHEGLPAIIGETIEDAGAGRMTVHVVVGLEEPWISLVPDLMFDLRSFLDWGRRGSCILHLLTRPSPQVHGSAREALEELERTRPFDDAFLVIASQEFLLQRVAKFLELCATVPETLFRPGEVQYRGPFASYGTSSVRQDAEDGADEDTERYLAHLDTVFRAAAPSWLPANPVLAELADERALYIHPPEAPPRDAAWKLCPEFVPVALEGIPPTLCRIQRGLRLEDLRLL